VSLDGVKRRKKRLYQLIKMLEIKKDICDTEKIRLNKYRREHRHCCKELVLLIEQKLLKKKKGK